MSWQEMIFQIVRFVFAIITAFSGVFAIAELWFGLAVADLPIDPLPVVVFGMGLLFSLLFYLLSRILKGK